MAALTASTLSITLGALPIFLVGALAVYIRPELGFSEARLGALATIYYMASAGLTWFGGKIAERLGGPKAMAVAAALSLASSLGIGLLARSWAVLALFLGVAGVGNALSFPASNLAIARGVPLRRQGVAFGVKQSSALYATMLSGAAVPLVGATIGWRWAFAFAALAALPVIAGFRIQQAKNHRERGTDIHVERGPVWMLAAGAFCAVYATASLGAFYVESAVSGGVSASMAGSLLAMGSIIGVAGRIGWGWFGDIRRDLHFVIVPTLLAAGALAFTLIGAVRTIWPLVVATVLVFGAGWAWPSLLNFGVISRSPRGPATASGILGTGQFGGGMLGPLTFGLIVERSGYQSAWTAAAAALALASVLTFTGGRWLERRTATEEIHA
jgi:predicted MFS family arabinose efflux permease